MLSFSTIKRSDLRKIISIRDEGDDLEQKMVTGAANFSLAHETFVMDLPSLKEPGIPSPVYTGTRVIEIENDAFYLLYEIYRDAGVQMFLDDDFLADYERAFEIIAETDRPDLNYTVQALRIPALYIEALWLHDDGNQENDKFIPLLTPIPGLEKRRIYGRDVFFSIVKDAAQNIEPSSELDGA